MSPLLCKIEITLYFKIKHSFLRWRLLKIQFSSWKNIFQMCTFKKLRWYLAHIPRGKFGQNYYSIMSSAWPEFFFFFMLVIWQALILMNDKTTEMTVILFIYFCKMAPIVEMPQSGKMKPANSANLNCWEWFLSKHAQGCHLYLRWWLHIRAETLMYACIQFKVSCPTASGRRCDNHVQVFVLCLQKYQRDHL